MSTQEGQSIWAERYEESRDRKGPFFDDLVSIRPLLDQAKQRRFLHETGPIFSFDPVHIDELYNKNRIRNITGEVALPASGDGVNVALRFNGGEEGVDRALSTFYTISSQGEAVDDDTQEVVADDETKQRLSSILEESKRRLSRTIEDDDEKRRRRRHRRNRAIRIGTSSLVSTGLLAGGVYYGVQNWIIQPQEAAQAHRQEYDAQNHTLPGEGVDVSEAPFSVISPSAFNAIPDYGGDDKNIRNPRKIELSYDDGCDSFDTKIPNGAQLKVVLPSNSPYQNDHYAAYRKGNQLTVCLTEELPYSHNQDGVEVAVQAQ